MHLANFIREHRSDIISAWERFAESLAPASPVMGSLALRDHIHEILVFTAQDIESPQTDEEQSNKSRGGKLKVLGYTAAETHAALRLAAGFNIEQMASEYRALRTSVIKLWNATQREPTGQDISDLTRFNESIDQQLMESINHYTSKVAESKNLFLGILGHDLRTPLSAASMSAQLLPKIGSLNERQGMLVDQIMECTLRASEIVSSLLDVTRARFGSGLPVVRHPMDMGFISRQLVDEMRAVYPEKEITLHLANDLSGEWDKSRIGQVFSNLIGNAVQYSFKGVPVHVRVEGTQNDVFISVQNLGVPIAANIIKTIFAPLTRGTEIDPDVEKESGHLGLGLYITKEIITAHGGTINVTSSEKEGTIFIVKLPRGESQETIPL